MDLCNIQANDYYGKTAESMATQETTIVEGKTRKKMERIIAYFKNHVFLSKFSKMDTNQDRAVKKWLVYCLSALKQLKFIGKLRCQYSAIMQNDPLLYYRSSLPKKSFLKKITDFGVYLSFQTMKK